MKQITIADIYERNDKIRQKLKDFVADITPGQESLLPEGEKWTLAQFVEHIATVEESMSKISYKLLSKAKAAGKTSDGKANITENYITKGKEILRAKLEALK